MSDLVLNALRRNRAIAAKAGQLERVERIDARLAELEKPKPKRSTKKKSEPDPVKEPDPFGFAHEPKAD